MPVGPTPEIVNQTLDLLETRLVDEIRTRHGVFDQGPIANLVGSWYLSAIYSQLTFDDFWLLLRRDEIRDGFPFVTGDEPFPAILAEMASRFVVAEVGVRAQHHVFHPVGAEMASRFVLHEVLSGEIDRLRALSWRMVGALVEESILRAELEPGRLPLSGDDEYLGRFRELSRARAEEGERELLSDCGEYLRLIREAFLEWLRAFRGVHIEALGEFAYVWLSNRRELREKYRSDGEPYVRGDEEPW